MSTEPIVIAEKENDKKYPIINCHTHIFTSDSVPPLLAKTFMPWPFYWILHIGWIIWVVKWWFNNELSPYRWRYQRWHRQLQHVLYKIKIAAVRSYVWGTLKFLLGLVIVASMFYELYGFYLRDWMINQGMSTRLTDKVVEWLKSAGILIITGSWMLKTVLLIILLTFFPSGRNLLIFILKKFSRVVGMLPGKQATELAKRYFNIVRFARYKLQSLIFSRLRAQYPNESAMVVLPMDMEFMGAGKPAKLYKDQMAELAQIKKNYPEHIYPFVFIDPRRTMVGSQNFLSYDIQPGKVELGDCFVKTYIEEKDFAGFKIYPALGYYPFEERLLPLWKYAADNKIPILTHCIRGTIYYRGHKKAQWDEHPVFEQYNGNDSDKPKKPEYFGPLQLPQMKAVDVQEIFTHPLNYACLLKKEWLSKLVAKAQDPSIRMLFGFNEADGTIKEGLEHLKICFGHFGGDDEWEKYMEKDRDNWAHQLTRYPDRGIEFIKVNDPTSRGREEQLWKYTDWYSIICSLMIQHDNVYADISYILHSDAYILPLLKQTLSHNKLKKQVLFGTDFYVVRNHKADKKMLADMLSGLNDQDFDQIARINPRAFLDLKPL